MKKLLIIGGTSFIGRNLVERLLALDLYALTLLNRGNSNPNLFPSVNRIKADRNTAEMKQISAEQWDFIIDLSCYFPNQLELVLSNLSGSPSKYVFVSTCSVYDNEVDQSILRGEDGPIVNCSVAQKTDKSDNSYGARKVACERILANAGLNHCVLRPALVYGPNDPSDRFYYWLHQVEKYNPLLLPDEGKKCFSTTYVMDLVETMVEALINDSTGAYNVTSQPQNSIEGIVALSSQQLDKKPNLYNAPAKFLHDHNVAQWMDLPLWLDAAHFTYSNARWLAHFNLAPTNFNESLAKTISHYQDKNWPEPIFGIDEERRQFLFSQLRRAHASKN